MTVFQIGANENIGNTGPDLHQTWSWVEADKNESILDGQRPESFWYFLVLDLIVQARLNPLWKNLSLAVVREYSQSARG